VQRKMYEAREQRGYQGTARGARRKRAGGLLVGRGPAGPASAMANPKLTWDYSAACEIKNFRSLAVEEIDR
jgi:hypothetical protein